MADRNRANKARKKDLRTTNRYISETIEDRHMSKKTTAPLLFLQ